MEDTEHARVGSVLLQRYRVDSVLGRGGMSTVYRGSQLSVKRPVAIKLIAGELVRDPENVQRFRREAEAMARLRHPNTVRIYEFGVTEDSELFIVMELLEGHDLAEQLRVRGQLRVHEALSIARQTLESLCEAHALGIVHRDLKPANVFLSQLPRDRMLVKVMDFGIAGIDELPSATKITRSGTMIGTPAYMSPEQALGRPVDPRSDLYSLGITLFEMLVGRTPFEGQPTASMLVAHATTPPPRLHDVRPELQFDEGLQRFLDRLLSKKPDERPASAEEALSEIEAMYTDEHSSVSALVQSDRTRTPVASYASRTSLGFATASKGAVGPSSQPVGWSSGAGWSALAQQVNSSLPPLLAAARSPRSWITGAAILALVAGGVFALRPKSAAVGADIATEDALEALRSVRIVTSPSHASVRLNGVELGITPYELQFRSSTEVTLTLPGYRPATLLVSSASEPNVAIELQANGAQRTAAVRADPQPRAAGASQQPTAASLLQPTAVSGRALTARARPEAYAAMSRRERRTAMLRSGPLYRDVASARRALQNGKLDDDLYRDVVWVLRTLRNERADALKLSYRRGNLSRAEYVRRAKLVEDEFVGK